MFRKTTKKLEEVTVIKPFWKTITKQINSKQTAGQQQHIDPTPLL